MGVEGQRGGLAWGRRGDSSQETVPENSLPFPHQGAELECSLEVSGNKDRL